MRVNAKTLHPKRSPKDFRPNRSLTSVAPPAKTPIHRPIPPQSRLHLPGGEISGLTPWRIKSEVVELYWRQRSAKISTIGQAVRDDEELRAFVDGAPSVGKSRQSANGAAGTNGADGAPSWRSKVRCLDLPSYLHAARPVRRFLIERWAPIGSTVALTGRGGRGKTTILQTAATCVQQGLAWCGRPVLQRPAVVIFGEESPDDILIRQFDINDYLGIGFASQTSLIILRTLRESTRRYYFQHCIDVIDLGLRLEDVEACGLESEDVFYREHPDSVRRGLTMAGASEAEIDFLLHNRVGLNALASDELVAWIEGKLEENGVRKVMPDQEMLAEAYRRQRQSVYLKEQFGELLERSRPSTSSRTCRDKWPGCCRNSRSSRGTRPSPKSSTRRTHSDDAATPLPRNHGIHRSGPRSLMSRTGMSWWSAAAASPEGRRACGRAGECRTKVDVPRGLLWLQLVVTRNLS